MQRQTQFYILLIISIVFIFSCSKNDSTKSNQDAFVMPAKFISVKNFGVIGDGKSDETAAFAKAQDYAYINKVALLIPNGYYKVNLELKYDSLYIFGENKPITRSDSLVNGAVDPDTSNNSLTKTTQIPTGSTSFKPLIEKFTSSTS